MKLLPCLFLLTLWVQLISVDSFQISAEKRLSRRTLVGIKLGEEESPTTDASIKLSLEEKMKQWEATEEEIKAATLGGVGIPKSNKERTGAFDIGLYIAFPFMIIGSLMFALFPFIMDKIDVTSVGPPPIV